MQAAWRSSAASPTTGWRPVPREGGGAHSDTAPNIWDYSCHRRAPRRSLPYLSCLQARQRHGAEDCGRQSLSIYPVTAGMQFVYFSFIGVSVFLRGRLLQHRSRRWASFSGKVLFSASVAWAVRSVGGQEGGVDGAVITPSNQLSNRTSLFFLLCSHGPANRAPSLMQATGRKPAPLLYASYATRHAYPCFRLGRTSWACWTCGAAAAISTPTSRPSLTGTTSQ